MEEVEIVKEKEGFNGNEVQVKKLQPDCQENSAYVPPLQNIVLERPFLITSKSLSNEFDKKFTLRVGDESMVFGLSESMKHPKESDDELYFVEGVENLDEVEVFDHLGTAGSIQPYEKNPYSRIHKNI